MDIGCVKQIEKSDPFSDRESNVCELEKRVENDLPKLVAYLDEGMNLAERCSALILPRNNRH